MNLAPKISKIAVAEIMYCFKRAFRINPKDQVCFAIGLFVAKTEGFKVKIRYCSCSSLFIKLE